MKKIKEMAAASGGSVAFGTGNAFKVTNSAAIVQSQKGKKKKPRKSPPMAQLYQEKILREAIRKLISLSKIKFYEEKGKEYLQEQKLRMVIRKLLSEKTEPTPYNNTGLNTAAEVIQRIKRTIIDNYKSLTSSDQQRKDFITTVEDMVKKAIEQQDLMKKIEAGNTGGGAEPQPSGGEEEFDLSGLTEQDEEGAATPEATPEEPAVPLANAEDSAKSDQEKSAAQAKQIATQVTSTEPDTTGGSKAIPVVSTIVPQILTARDTLKDAKDKSAFDLAIIGGNGQIGNIKAFADIAEKELQATVAGTKGTATTPETGAEPNAAATGGSELAGGTEAGGGEELNLGL